MQGSRPRTRPGNRGVSGDPETPSPLNSDSYSYSWAAPYRLGAKASVFNAELALDEVETILGQRDPQRPGEIPGAAAQTGDFGGARSAASALRHQRDAVNRLQRSNKHGRRMIRRLGDGVHQIMDPVVQIDVRDAGRAVERLVAHGGSGRRVTRGIVLPDVRLDLDDHARREAARRTVHEHLTEQIRRNLERGPVVKRARQHKAPLPCFTTAGATSPRRHWSGRTRVRREAPGRCTSLRSGRPAPACRSRPPGRRQRRPRVRDRSGSRRS
jgi:hypothetical protein